MPKQGFITLYFDPEAYKAEEGDKLTHKMLESFGRDMNEQAAHLCGYEGWVSGWLNLPAKPLTSGDYYNQVMSLSRTHHAHLTINDGGRVSGVVSDKVSGTEFDVGIRLDDSGVERYYANDDDGIYYYGETLAQAVAIGFEAQKEN